MGELARQFVTDAEFRAQLLVTPERPLQIGDWIRDLALFGWSVGQVRGFKTNGDVIYEDWEEGYVKVAPPNHVCRVDLPKRPLRVGDLVSSTVVPYQEGRLLAFSSDGAAVIEWFDEDHGNAIDTCSPLILQLCE